MSDRDATAVLVIDMQNSFCRTGGVMSTLLGPIEGIDAVVGALGRFLAEARRHDVPVVYLRMVFQPNYADADAVFRRRLPEAVERGALARGGHDAEIIEELAPRPGDTVIDKNRFDGFHATPLAQTLTNLGVGRLLIGGVLTNICVETTTRAAYINDFLTVLLTDCCGSTSARAHERALEAMDEGRFAELTPSADALPYLTGG